MAGPRAAVGVEGEAQPPAAAQADYLQQWGAQTSKGGHLVEQVVAIDARGDIVVVWP